jgi:hypothetical protein
MNSLPSRLKTTPVVHSGKVWTCSGHGCRLLFEIYRFTLWLRAGGQEAVRVRLPGLIFDTENNSEHWWKRPLRTHFQIRH